jgi:UPF0716 protein FxsA
MAAPPRRRFNAWALVVVIAAIAWPIAEFALIIRVADWIGIGWMIMVMIGTAILGGWLMGRESRQSRAAYRDLRTARRTPQAEVIDVLLIMAGGILLLLPGFIGDVVGLILILPFTRPLPRWGATRLLNRWLQGRGVDVARLTVASTPGTIIQGETVPDSEDPPDSASSEEDGPDDGQIIIRGEIEP